MKPSLNIPKIVKLVRKKQDFQDEFMEKYNDFSESWRNEIDASRKF